MKKIIRTDDSINDIRVTEPILIKSRAPIPKMFRTEYTVSIYAVIIPSIINIHAASLVLGQSIMAKKAAAAPRTS
jgi:hypothetical protein